jgi:saccharopine dehydrogenase-like NADP-dependent oxidoreductase
MEWLGLFENRRINGSGKMSSAAILQSLIEDKWRMRALDKDMVVMQHQVEYERKGTTIKLTSEMVVIGDNRHHSAMSKTVGLPMAILAKKILLQEISTKNLTGVRIPVMPEVYVPILKELKKNGIEFVETVE